MHRSEGFAGNQTWVDFDEEGRAVVGRCVFVGSLLLLFATARHVGRASLQLKHDGPCNKITTLDFEN